MVASQLTSVIHPILLETVKLFLKSFLYTKRILSLKDQRVCTPCKFSLNHATREQVNTLIKDLDTGISVGHDKIPAKYVKMVADILDEPLTKVINTSIYNNKFCESAKIAVVPPIYKEKDRTLKENYRPVSILNVSSKVFEKHLKNSIDPFVDEIISALSAYNKHYGTGHVIMKLIEEWRKHLDQWICANGPAQSFRLRTS